MRLNSLTIYVGILLLFISINGFSAKIQGIIIGISDGDTVKLLDSENKQYKIRLNCIDAPEKRQDFGEKSKESLSDMIFGKYVEVYYNKLDRYGRIVGTIYHNGVDINLEQVKRGMAWVYTRYCSDREYKKQENIAKKNKKGLWILAKPIEPWVYRKEIL